MTRDELFADIRRVAEEAGVEPQNLRRAVYLAKGICGYRYEQAGTWNQARVAAAMEAGIAPTLRHLAESSGTTQELSYARKLERTIGRADWFADRLDSALSRAIDRQPIVAAKVIKPKALKKRAPQNASLTALLSDLHFGVGVDPKETPGSEYSWTIACRRLAKVAEQCAEWKPQHRDRTKLVVCLNGDLIEGVIHLDNHLIDPLATQIVGAALAIISFLDFLRGHFASIEVICKDGNHDRSPHRGHGRATAQRWDSHARAIFLALETAYRHADDVRIVVTKEPFASYRTPGGHLTVVSHGDAEPTIANPGKSINTDRLANKLRQIDSAGIFDRKVDVLALGHWHQPAFFMVPHGGMVVVNGSLIGGSPYSMSGAGVYNSEPAQVMWESVERYPMGDSRIIRLRDADGRPELSEIVPTPAL